MLVTEQLGVDAEHRVGLDRHDTGQSSAAGPQVGTHRSHSGQKGVLLDSGISASAIGHRIEVGGGRRQQSDAQAHARSTGDPGCKATLGRRLNRRSTGFRRREGRDQVGESRREIHQDLLLLTTEHPGIDLANTQHSDRLAIARDRDTKKRPIYLLVEFRNVAIARVVLGAFEPEGLPACKHRSHQAFITPEAHAADGAWLQSIGRAEDASR
jgi:hypothetical protein